MGFTISFMPPIGSTWLPISCIIIIAIAQDYFTKLNEWLQGAKAFSKPQNQLSRSSNEKCDRSPDAVWIESDRWEALSPEEQAGFPPLCPDFVIELRSKTDALPPLQEKMAEYLASGLRLGW